MSVSFREAPAASQSQVVVHSDGDGPVTIPDAARLFRADFARDGSDLVLRTPGSPDIRVPGYFDGSPADLRSPEGAVIRGRTVELLAGPEAPGQYAQAGAVAAALPIGQVESVAGEATVQRTDGTVETLAQGSKVFLNDVLQTGAEGSLSVTFVDGTIFTLSAASRMVIDELIYDPAGQDNFGSFNLIEGGFVFIAGQVARTGGMDVTTPAATMGIKGTTVLVEIQTENGVANAQVTLLRDPDGDVGRVELFDVDRNLIATITEANSSWIVSTVEGETREVAQGGGTDASDSVLIAEAVAAYQSAFGRVGQGGSFVELDSILRGGSGGGQGGGRNGIDLDSDDAEELPELAPPPELAPGDGDTQDEGRNGLDGTRAPNLRVTGLEDAGEGDPIGGSLAAIAGAAPGSTFAIAGNPANGALVLQPDGSFVYVPVENFNGSDAFVYSVTGADGAIATGVVTIEVVPVNDAPQLAGAVAVSAEDTVIGGRLTATDIDGDPLTYGIARGAANGSVVVAADGAWAYTPNPDFAGADSFEVRVTDAAGASAVATVAVAVAERPDAPRPATAPDAARGFAVEGGAAVTGLLAATDPDPGATLAWSGSAAGRFGTFTVAANGAWTYVAGPTTESLAAGATVTESFVATVTDESGRTATETVVVTVRGSNDAPVTADVDVDTTRGAAISGTVLAQDVDAGDRLTFAAGPRGPANGSVTVAPDGSFTYVPAAGFRGLDGFDVVVSDGQGGSAVSRVTVAVLAPDASGGNGSSVSLDIVGTPGADPAGTVISTATPVDATGVNLVVALDRSGSIGATQWTLQVNQVADALEALAQRFAGAATSVDVRIVAYASSAAVTPTFDLTDPALISTVRSLPYTGGGTNYTSALTAAETFFDGQPAGEANFLYFITDGQPNDTTWPGVLDRLTDEATKGYPLRIEAFGIGGGINFTTLSAFDDTPQLLDSAGDLTDAFTATPLFSADLVSLTVTLIADGVDRGVIADETSPGVMSQGLVTTLSLADIAGIASLLGTSNRVSATAGYDLDGDASTIEAELFSSKVLARAATAQTLTGTAGSDLLLGSDSDDRLEGGPGNDVLLGFGGNDTLRTGAGLDTVLAGAGDDRIVVTSLDAPANAAREVLDGGTGRDVLDVDSGGDLTGVFDLVDLRGVESIDMANGQANALRLSVEDILGMSDESDRAVEAVLGGAFPNARAILGDAGDTLTLALDPGTTATKTGSVAAAGGTFDVWSLSDGSDVLATLAVDAEVAVSTQTTGT